MKAHVRSRAGLLSILGIVLLLLAACGGDAATVTSPAPTATTAPPPATATTAPAAATDTAAPALATATTAMPAATDTAAPALATATTAPAAPTATTAPPTVAAVPTLAVDKSKLSKELNLYTWVNYMKPEILDQFQKEYGVKVNMDTYDSNEALLAKLQAGATGYDVTVPSDYMVAIMAKSDLLLPLDRTMLPNFANLDPLNLSPYYDPDNKYSVPWKWGTSGIAYDSAKVSPAPDSWAVMFDPKYKGQISMLNDEREVPAAAAHLLGFSENTTKPDELAKIKAKLLEQKPLVKAYTSDTNRDLLASGEVVLAQIFTGDALKVAETKPTIKYVIPKEGCTIWQDNMAIPKSAPNQYTAYVFINFLLRADVEAANTLFIKYATPNKAARALLPADVLQNQALYPSAGTVKTLEWIHDLGDNINLYDRMWTEVKNQ